LELYKNAIGQRSSNVVVEDRDVWIMSSSSNNDNNSSSYCISFADVDAAARRIEGVAHRTPVLTCASLDEQASNKKLFFKVEKTGSFKFRGALNAVRSVLEKEEEEVAASAANVVEAADGSTPPTAPPLQVVTHSSGNHAQALALAARMASTDRRQVVATIVMPDLTPLVKKNAVIAYGGIPVMVASTNEAREEAAERIQKETGAVFIHPSEDPRVIAGQGTVCLELYQQMKELTVVPDVVVIPVGGGGLAAGNIISLRHLYGNAVRIVLAEPAVLDDAQRSFRAGERLNHDPSNQLLSVADGLKTTLGPHTWPIIRDLADDVMTVSERDILVATKLVWERLKVVIEPSAGVGVAVVLSNEFATKYVSAQNVAVVLCGGNVDVIKIAGLMAEMAL
jgi:serine racemase